MWLNPKWFTNRHVVHYIECKRQPFSPTVKFTNVGTIVRFDTEFVCNARFSPLGGNKAHFSVNLPERRRRRLCFVSSDGVVLEIICINRFFTFGLCFGRDTTVWHGKWFKMGKMLMKDCARQLWFLD